MWTTNINKSDLKINDKISTDFYYLEELMLNFDVKNNKKLISDLISKIISYKDEIKDDWLMHDFNNATMCLWKIQMSINGIIPSIDNYLKFFIYAKNSIEDILDIKSSYNINDVKNILIELSFLNDIEIDMIFDEFIFNEMKNINIDSGEIKSANNTLFRWDDLKEVFPVIKLEIRRIFQNLIKNSKEAWATKLSVTFWQLPFSSRFLIKYLDNWCWMNFDTIKNTLFISWKSLKWNSWTNIWVWMSGLSKWFYKNDVDLDIYSISNEWEYIWVWIPSSTFREISYWKSEIDWIVNTTELWYYNWDFPNKTWTEFVFKF